ncbi:hypothetical protein PROFUN_03844 [Planoprotostelium fungivorum]|uniref:Uncharacterized protein n=1 Tax=Planoprotostelium fungivorum TaxID=1890364 RepID=A0A2P6NIC5_9EUKA|nr:hypothetical protein PROFUN_03844 [Planoprotostelium fungivorum]
MEEFIGDGQDEIAGFYSETEYCCFWTVRHIVWECMSVKKVADQIGVTTDGIELGLREAKMWLLLSLQSEFFCFLDLGDPLTPPQADDLSEADTHSFLEGV